MLKVNVLNMSCTHGRIELSDDIFGIEVNEHAK